LWKWYERFAKRLHALCIGKYFIEILSGTFKKKKGYCIWLTIKSYKQNGIQRQKNRRAVLKIRKANSYTTWSQNEMLHEWHCCFVPHYHKARRNFNVKIVKYLEIRKFSRFESSRKTHVIWY
jgi:hypothetical protein